MNEINLKIIGKQFEIKKIIIQFGERKILTCNTIKKKKVYRSISSVD
jgi:hypothetical protein